ncbi:MAG TPA: TDP-N-acetylfucosamine:lipid II N-acetylfucosaminyltransferase [Clostridiales bacterium]|nr:TDP-N-acetylfucosamine:lipid II N-acetylfucosaminyltransferase [Clostridiales bacterium]
MHQIIAHYVSESMFAHGYINYMQNVMKDYEHVFITGNSLNRNCCVKQANIIQISKDWEILTNSDVRKVLYSCDKLIVTGIFSKASYLALILKSFFGKTYPQFWGGDFYNIRDNDETYKEEGFIKWLKKKIVNTIKKVCIIRCTAVVTLIEEDYDELEKITGIRKRHYVASVPDDGIGGLPVLKMKDQSFPVIILLGNSATETNHHIDALDMLKKFSKENIEIICPLSYGSREYAERVIEYGKKYFNAKFIPLINLIPKDEYLKLLSDVRIAMFNNDRQQGMGNISRLLATGCKVYLKNDTSMWSFYKNRGYSVNDIDNIKSLDFDELVSFSQSNAIHNNGIFLQYSDPTILYNSWKRIFEDRV